MELITESPAVGISTQSVAKEAEAQASLSDFEANFNSQENIPESPNATLRFSVHALDNLERLKLPTS